METAKFGVGTKIEFLSDQDQGEIIRSESLCSKKLKTVFGCFVAPTAFSPHFGSASVLPTPRDEK